MPFKDVTITGISCTQEKGSLVTSNKVENVTWTTVDSGRLAIDAEWSSTMPCLDSNGEPMKFESGEAYSGKLWIEYYYREEGSSAERFIAGTIYVKAT